MQVEKIIGQYMDVNCYCVTNDFNECLIIEAGASAENMEKLVKDKKVVGILLTHGHFDHVYFVKEYLQKFNAPIYAHKFVPRAIKDHKYNLAEEWEEKEDLPLNLIEGDGKFKIGHFDVQYFYCPGHSPCSVCYLIDGLLFGGDVLFNAGVGRSDFFASSKEDMIASLEKLKSVKFDYLYSGHGKGSDYERQKRNIAVFSRFLSKSKAN